MMRKAYALLLLSIHAMPASADIIPFDLLKEFVPVNPIILEAGAQFGEDTKWMSELWQTGKIFSFEPHPDAYPKLADVAQQRHNIIAAQLALSNKTEELCFYKAGGASSLLKPDYAFFDHDGSPTDINSPIIVKATTIDEWAAQNAISHIDFMWLDMEGNELNALKGAQSILKTVKVIYTEVNLQRFWHQSVLYHEIKAWLEEQGFEKIWDDVAPGWRGNALFIRKELR